MASVVNVSRSKLIASDEIYTKFCNPCNSDGFERQAARYCQDCNEFLCLKCTESHKRFKNLKNHQILTANEIPRTTGDCPESHDEILCVCEQTSEATGYCETHNEVICETCKTLKHRKCNNWSLAKKSASYTAVKLNKIQEEVKEMENKFEQFKQKRSSDLQELLNMKEKCLNEIKGFRKELDNLLDTLEQSIKRDLETRVREQRQEIEHHIDSCLTTIKTIKADSKLVYDAKQSDRKDKMFVTDIKISTRFEDYKALLQDVKTETKKPILAFERDKKLVEMLSNIGAMGQVIFQEGVEPKKAPNKTRSNVVIDKHVINSEQVIINSSDDVTTPWVTGCTFMPNGQALLCDYNNKKAKLLDYKLTPIGSLNLQDRPWDASSVDSSNVIVSFPLGRILQIIQVLPSLKAGRVIQVKKMCWGVTVVGDDIYVACHKGPGDGEVQIITDNGIVNKIITRLANLSGPSYISVSRSTRNIYVADWKTSLLSRFKSDGGIVFQYSNPDLHGLKGIYADAEDNIVACGRDTNNIYIVSSNGKEHKTLLPVKDGIPGPCCVTYRPDDSILIVGCYKNNNLYVFKLA